MRQDQKSGDQSVNIQASVLNVGLTYDDARAIAMDVFEANFARLAGSAIEVARNRAEELIGKYLESLASKNPEAVASAKDPDMQYALFAAQQAYARSGDKPLGDVLVDILVERASQNKRSIVQIVLNESIEVAPKLTDYQFDIVSLVFLLRYTKNHGLASLPLLKQYLQKMVLPFLPGLRRNDSSFQHLEFAGCGTVQLGSTRLEKLLLASYPGLLSEGFSREELDELRAKHQFPPGLFVSCLHDSDRFQISALDSDHVRVLGSRHKLDEHRVDELVKAFNASLLPEPEVRRRVISMVPEIETLFEIWDATPMKSFTLTSVGMAIGHANLRRKTGEHFDLGIWIK